MGSSLNVFFIGTVVTMLSWLVLSLPVWAAEEEGQLRVISTPTGLTVEAQGVSVEEILRAVGVQVGFTVVAKEAHYPLLSLAIKDATVEEVIEQLLRGESYAVVYREPKGGGKEQEGGEISQIRLLSPSTTLAATLEEKPKSLGVSSTGQARAVVSEKKEPVPVQERIEENAPVVSQELVDLLETQAWQISAAWRRQTATQNAAETVEAASAGEAASLMGPSENQQRDQWVERYLTTQKTLRNFAVLVEGLAGATRAARDSFNNQGAGAP
jgi:hypothetical protein